MPDYRIHRMKDTPRENFRWAVHTGGEAMVKARDYEAGGTVEAATPYAAWKRLAEEAEGLRPGDLLEIVEEGGETAEVAEREPRLLIAKYIGFEPARWLVAEPKKAEGRGELPTLSSEARAIPAGS